MTKYHVNDKGEPGLCTAAKNTCRFGSTDEHSDSKEQAREKFEASMANELFATASEQKFLTPVPEMFYHVTAKSNLANILKNGLIPATGERSQAIAEEEDRVYLFDSKESAEDGGSSWLADEYEDDEEELVLIGISSSAIVTPKPSFDDPEGSYEWTTTKAIMPADIAVLNENF